MKDLKASKAKFKAASGSEWTQKSLEELEQKRSSTATVEELNATADAPTFPASGALTDAEQTLLTIRQVGDDIRKLKAQKADKVGTISVSAFEMCTSFVSDRLSLVRLRSRVE